MKRKLLAALGVMALLSGSVAAMIPATFGWLGGAAYMPANPDKILAALIERGEVSENASPYEKERVVQEYLQLKMAKGDADKAANPMAGSLVRNSEKYLIAAPGDIRGKKLGSEFADPEPSTPLFKPLEGEDQLLLILVDFSDEEYTWQPVEIIDGEEVPLGDERTEAGPLHNQIPLPDNDFDLWVSDFSPQHFEDMMFTPGGWTLPADHPYYPSEKRGSMRDYFLEQSYGKYTVNGEVYGWFTVDKPEAYYGDDDPDGGSDSLRPGTPRDLLADAVDVINAAGAIDWLAYDLADPYDLDDDGITDEPDCILDHPLFVHAGIDQSGGGGAQGDDAIWAHSASTWEVVTTEKNPDAACPADYPGTMLYNYTIMPEDGGVGVFAHEFAHDLGLPDEYDTAYTGYGASTAFWTLQSSGSWVGQPAQTQPSGMSIWARWVLGWVAPGDNLAEFHVYDDLQKEPLVLRMEQSEFWGGEGTINAVKINLPDKYYYVNEPYSGDWEWFGGRGDWIDTTLRRTVDLSGKTNATLSFATWYDIEENWDYGFVQVSVDGGATWIPLEIEGMTDDVVPDARPEIFPNLPGFTGSTDGAWLEKTVDISEFCGGSIELQFRYITDWATNFAGFYVDDIRVTADNADVFFDDVEVLDPAWAANGWTREEGSGYKPHFYIMEWRNLNEQLAPLYEGLPLVNFDAGLNSVYTYDPFGDQPNQPYYFPYAPGLLLYYRDITFAEGDNWTGMHPGGGYMLIVDAHKRPLIRPPYQGNYGGLEWDTRVQSFDAAFGLDDVPDIELTRYGITQTYYGTSAVPNFKDSQTYWSEKAPSASVITPKYGLLFRILGQADDMSAINIGFGNKGNLEEEYLSVMSDFFQYWDRYFVPMVLK